MEADPKFANAWALLADTHLRRAEKAGWSRREDYFEAVRLCRAALAVDSLNVLALETLGNVTLYHLWQFQEAVDALEQVLRIEPDNQRARRQLAEALTLSGRFDDALSVIADGRSESAFAAQYLGLQRVLTFQGRGDKDAALDAGRAFVRAHPNFHLAHWVFGSALRATGNLEAAASEFRTCLRLSGGRELRCRVALAVAGAQQGRPGEVRTLLSDFESVQKEHGFGANVIRAMLLSSVGRDDDAVGSLLQAAQLSDPDLAFVWFEPQLEALRSHRNFGRVGEFVPAPHRVARASVLSD